MNKAIQRIKNAALQNASPFEKKEKVILDTDRDEEIVAGLMSKWLDKDITATNGKNRWCRWDVECEGLKGEVKSRTYTKPEWDSWVIDTYKIDHLLEKYPDDDIYFINVFEEQYHVYKADYVATCPKVKRMAKFRDGRGGLREYYEIPKDAFLVELKTTTSEK